MGNPTGFMEFEREAVPYRDPLERLKDYDEINTRYLTHSGQRVFSLF